MESKWKEYFLLYSTSEEYKGAIEKAQEEISRDLDGSSYVACSGGKDSLVLLSLCQIFKPDVATFHWDHGPALMPRAIEADIKACMQACAPQAVFYFESFDKGSKESARWEYYTWYKSFYGTLARFKKQHNFGKSFIGLRAEESSKRSARVTDGKSGIEEIYPIKNWTWRDIWGYIIRNKIIYPHVYDIYAELLGYENARLVTFHDAEFDKFGSRNLDNILMWRDKNFYLEK